MAVTTTPSMSSLIAEVSTTHPTINFTASEWFAWNPDTRTISYVENGAPARLLHELGHADLDHCAYQRDIQLLEMERDAWDRARQLASDYHCTISDDAVDDHLDSYRNWLHARSTCPRCEALGIQTDAARYTCMECAHAWRVNEARTCELRRYSENTPV